MVDQRESQSLLSVGIAWASRITTIALELSVPAAIGFGLDRWLSTAPLATVSGAVSRIRAIHAAHGSDRQ